MYRLSQKCKEKTSVNIKEVLVVTCHHHTTVCSRAQYGALTKLNPLTSYLCNLVTHYTWTLAFNQSSLVE